MFSFTSTLFLRPRNIKFTPPPLVRRSGNFKCRNCKFWWHSNHVWVTKASTICYQGQSCEKCGNIEKPYYIQEFEGSKSKYPIPKDSKRPSNYRKILKHSTMNRGRG